MRKHLLHWTTGLGPTPLSSQAAAQDDLTEVPLLSQPVNAPVASPATSGRARSRPCPRA